MNSWRVCTWQSSRLNTLYCERLHGKASPRLCCYCYQNDVIIIDCRRDATVNSHAFIFFRNKMSHLLPVNVVISFDVNVAPAVLSLVKYLLCFTVIY